jgi:transposase-like protein
MRKNQRTSEQLIAESLQRGESFAAIAKRFNVSPKQISYVAQVIHDRNKIPGPKK